MILCCLVGYYCCDFGWSCIQKAVWYIERKPMLKTAANEHKNICFFLNGMEEYVRLMRMTLNRFKWRHESKWERDDSELKKKRDADEIATEMKKECSKICASIAVCIETIACVRMIFTWKIWAFCVHRKRALNRNTHIENNHAHANSRDTKGRFIASSSTHPNKWTRWHYLCIHWADCI